MLCSARTGKSGSNWLDRLRSNKGIPTGDDLDLDSFLLTTHSHSPQPRPNNPTRTRPSEIHDPPMSTLLAELFNMGNATLTQTSKKCPRKQTNPKFFLASSSTDTRNVTAGGGAVPSTLSDAAEAEREEEETAVDRGEEEEENDNDGNELKGFTRSEVTVIDTSCTGWKVDKFVFKKNNVWKVRERKPKTKYFAKKKKSNGTLDINGIETSKDNVVNVIGEKPAKTHKVI
ncbi:uncharacterized protein LOC133307552 [Gastrolobium bilobum]|uniref:uncharacterized protein LOC133307552 n=1 Tax=Gastrolobium bilobum TaxID=150636 RepID=UPI002AB2BB75|nr:uncharacterized protein LOC133307552 [Gastrolobium bilobum]